MKLILTLLLAQLVFAQASRRLEFEVASVKPSVPNQGNGAQTPAGARLNPSQIRLTYLTLQDFIVRAYAVKAYQVIGPEWLKTERFDIAATIPEGATTADVPAMLQSLLEDRFGLKVHRAQKEFAVYVLTRGKRPFTLTEVPPRDPDSTTTGVAARPGNGVALNLPKGALFTFADNKLDGKGMTMDMLANNLANFVGLPTVNGTELNGYYDIALRHCARGFQRDDAASGGEPGSAVPAGSDGGVVRNDKPDFAGRARQSGFEAGENEAAA